MYFPSLTRLVPCWYDDIVSWNHSRSTSGKMKPQSKSSNNCWLSCVQERDQKGKKAEWKAHKNMWVFLCWRAQRLTLHWILFWGSGTLQSVFIGAWKESWRPRYKDIFCWTHPKAQLMYEEIKFVVNLGWQLCTLGFLLFVCLYILFCFHAVTIIHFPPESMWLRGFGRVEILCHECQHRWPCLSSWSRS